MFFIGDAIMSSAYSRTLRKAIQVKLHHEAAKIVYSFHWKYY